MKLARIINLIILCFAFAFMIVGVYQFFETFIGFSDLIHHKGVVESKWLSKKYFTHRSSISHRDEKDSVLIFNFAVDNDEQKYTASRYPEGIDNLVEIGDTIDFYTRKVSSMYGNTVNNGNGRFWNTHSPNEVFHMVSKKYSDPIVDFYEYRASLRRSWWVFPFFSIIILGWFLYRRSGKKSPFVTEYARFDV